jgi:adenylylsulfate kinase-like enzyme
MSSTQGTFVNKKEVPKGVYYKARSGSIIQITSKQFLLARLAGSTK